MIVRRINPGIFTALWLLPILALLQASLAGHLAVRGAMPGVVLITIVIWGILRGMEEGVLWAFVGGICLDVFTTMPFGTNTVALVIVASLVSLGQGTFIRTHTLLPLFTVFGATLLYYAVLLFVLTSTQQQVDWLSALRFVALPIAVYNAVLSVVIYRLLQRLEAKIYPEPRANW